jgi:integrase
MGPGIPAFISHANCSSKRITPHFVSVMVKARFRAIGLDDKLFSSHSLRHSAAYYATKAGSSSFEVQQMMRHKDGRATEQYKKAFNQERIKDGTSIFYLDNYLKKCQERCGK